MNTSLPVIPECADLLHLAGRVVKLSVNDIAVRCRWLPVRLETDSVRRVDIDHLDFASQSFPLHERRHNLKGIPQYHSVGPVRRVAVEIDEVEVRQAVEGVEERKFRLIGGSA